MGPGPYYLVQFAFRALPRSHERGVGGDMIEFIAVLLSAGQTAEPPRAVAPPALGSTYVLPKVTCPPGPEDTQRLLALSFHDFDQNPLSGWRPYGSNGCYMDGARLIDAYADKITDAKSLSGLRFHQFQ